MKTQTEIKALDRSERTVSRMTIDEAIKHCEELVEQEECFINYPHSDIILGDLDIESRKHAAAEQRQLAEWLRELKELREIFSKVDTGAIKPKDRSDWYE